ncbi:galactose oxidase [Gigaspora margarita]|uniref:Galactose oxidase n=1 Tax=Gigaspora margarita TaxID=4874 RepID=A0A8H4ERB6_GIGMA|nr:galactose oxidase [Gigaspora margarita]
MKLLYSILFFVIFSSVYYFVICQDVPSPRRQHTSTLVGTRLYFFGGATSSTRKSNEVWYHDLSSSFNISTPPWHSDVVMPVAYNFGTSCLSPIDNSTVFLIGGRTFIPISATTDYYSYISSVYKFNSKTSQWTTPTINNFNSSFATRNEIQAVIDNNGKIFIFGGTNYDNLTTLFYNDMNILDTTNMTWSTPIQSQSVLTYLDYTATLLPNGLIVYVGGRSGSSSNVNLIDMAQIQIFDTKSYTWSAKSASGSTIASRTGHSAVLTQDGNIIIYGGSLQDSSGNPATLFSDIAVLNTNSWVWSVPSVSGTSAPPLTRHSAALYKNYMILAFGATSASNLYTNDIYILNIQNYTWVAKFNVPTTTIPPKQPPSTGNSSTDQANNNFTYLYIGIGIGAGVVILTAVLLIIGFFIYKNRHGEEFIMTSGTSRNDHIRETHMSTVYTTGIPPPETYVQTPLYGVPAPGSN